MIRLLKYCWFVFLASLPVFSTAQLNNNSFIEVDAYVKNLGPLDTLNMGTIAQIVTYQYPDSKDKLRAIYDWVTLNINFDFKKYRTSGNEKMNSTDVLKTRKANASGYAALFQDMCSVVKIRCLTVDGYVKMNTEQINEKPDAINHSWVVVQLGQSPDSWFYIDPAWGSGFTDEKITSFTKAFNSAYFFADKLIFNYQHYPDNTAWMLGPGPKSLGDFMAMPLVKDAALEFGINSFSPSSGNIKTKINNAVHFNLNIVKSIKINSVAILIGEGKRKLLKTVDYSMLNNRLIFSYKFSEEDVFPVSLLINNKPVLGYVIEVIE